MKKNIKFYSLGWILLLGLFNLLAFIIPAAPDTVKYTASFWIGYSFVTAAFIGQFACTWFVLKEENAKKMFYKLSLIKTSYVGLIATFIAGAFCMIVPVIPYWISAILCAIILVINVFAFAKAKLAVDYVAGIDEKVAAATSFIYDMRDASEAVLARANDETKAVCKKVRDAFKYSDPMSSEALNEVESEIGNGFNAFKAAVRGENAEEAASMAEELLALIAERNSKCKRLK